MKNTVALVIGFVGIALLGCLVGIVVLALNSQPTPDVLQNVAVGCLTGLVGLLVPSGRESVAIEPKGDVVVSDLGE